MGDGADGPVGAPAARAAAAGPAPLSCPGDPASIPDDVLAPAHERAARPRARATGPRPTGFARRDRGGRLEDRRPRHGLRADAGRAAGPRRGRGRSATASSATCRRGSTSRPSGLATVILVATDWPADLERALARPARPCAGRDVGRHRRRRAVDRAGRGARGAGARRPQRRPDARDRLDERAARARRGAERRHPSRERTGRRRPRHERRADRRHRDAARPRRSTTRPSPSPAAGASCRRPAQVRGRAARRRRRDRGLSPWRSGAPTSRRAARSTSASASTATSTSGGASSCATKGRASRPRRAVAARRLPVDAPRASRLDEPPDGGTRPPEQAQLLPDHRPLRVAARPAGRPSRLGYQAAPTVEPSGPSVTSSRRPRSRHRSASAGRSPARPGPRHAPRRGAATVGRDVAVGRARRPPARRGRGRAPGRRRRRGPASAARRRAGRRAGSRGRRRARAGMSRSSSMAADEAVVEAHARRPTGARPASCARSVRRRPSVAATVPGGPGATPVGPIARRARADRRRGDPRPVGRRRTQRRAAGRAAMRAPAAAASIDASE